MNKIALVGALFVAFFAAQAALAQAPASKPAQAAPAAKAQPAPAAPAKAPATAASAKAPAPASAAAPATTVAAADADKPVKKVRHRVPSKADARVCLEFPTTAQIIKCSEKYRWAS